MYENEHDIVYEISLHYTFRATGRVLFGCTFCVLQFTCRCLFKYNFIFTIGIYILLVAIVYAVTYTSDSNMHTTCVLFCRGILMPRSGGVRFHTKTEPLSLCEWPVPRDCKTTRKFIACGSWIAGYVPSF